MNTAQREDLLAMLRKGDIKGAAEAATARSCLSELIASLATNKDYRLGFTLLRGLGRDPVDYPALIERAEKAYIRHFIRSMDADVMEAILAHERRMLGYLAEESHYRGDMGRAIAIVKRHNLAHLPLKVQLRQDVALHGADAVTPNPILDWNEFAPLESVTQAGKTFLHLSDFGLGEDAVRLFSSAADMPAAVAQLEALRLSPLIGLDTENRPGRLPFSVCAADLLQIADRAGVYLFSLPHMADTAFWEALSALLADKAVLKLGFDFKHDVKRIQSAFGREGLYVTNYIDVGELHAGLSACKRVNLSAVCQSVLHKPLSKTECLFDWKVQPLRRFQTHYAALDAYVLVGLFDRLAERHHFEAVAFSDSFGAEF